MIDAKERTDAYQSHFKRLEHPPTGLGPSALLPIRKAAFARFVELGWPTTRHEEWRYTNVTPIADTPFKAAGLVDAPVQPAAIERFLFDRKSPLLVFVNARFVSELSVVPSHVDGVKVVSLASAMKGAHGRLWESHLARHARYDDDAFTALNTALMEDGAVVFVPKGRVIEGPLHLLFVSTTPGTPIVSHPRTLIVLEESSQATIVESYVRLGGGKSFTNAVTEIVAGDNAVVDHYKVVREGDEAFHIGALQVHQFRCSHVSSHAVTLGGGLVRNDIHAVLDGEGGECLLTGTYFAGGREHVDHHLIVEHVQPHCNSREFFKGVLDGRGRGVFSGRIIVREGAQKTDAKQTNQSLLLSADAQVESKPQLEIFADDVKCTHGATVGQVSEEAVFYLRSRGLSPDAARNLLVQAFARENLEKIRITPLRAQLNRLLLARLPEGPLLGEAT